MKRIASSMAVMLIASFTLVSMVVPSAVAAPLADGLISYYPLDTSGSDATSNNYDGTNAGSPAYSASDVAPQISDAGAVAVDPSDGSDYVQIPDNSDLDLGSASGGTWLAWVKFGTTGTVMNPLSKSMQYWIHATADDEIQAKVSVGGTIYIATTPTGTVETTAWHQVAGTYDGENLKLYLDGVLVDTNTGPSGVIDDTGNDLDLGAWSASPGTDPYSGLLDEVRIYGRALTGTEIAFMHSYTGASLDLGPDAVNAVTDTHAAAAQLTPALSFIPVRFEIPPITLGGSAVNPQSVEVAMTDENGIATRTAYTGTNTGSDDIAACLETTAMGAGLCTSGDAAADTAVKYWISELTLSQDFDVNLAGATHTAYAMLDVAVAGVHIQFSVSGQNSDSSDETTDGFGQATFTYVSDGNPGDDVITAFVDFDDNGTLDGSDFAATADLDKYWVSDLTLTPASDTNPITATHTVVGTLDNGVDDVPILFEVIAGPNAGDSGSVTTTSGVAWFTYGGPSAGTGTDTIDAYADLNGNATFDSGVDLPASATASKSWYSRQVIIGGTGGQSVPKGKGRTEWSLSGLANNQAPAGYGEINVNYKAIKDTCSFKPDANSSVVTVTATQLKLENWSATCKVATSTDADLWFDSSVGTKGGFKIDFNNDGAFTNGRDVPIATGTGFFVPLSTGSMTLVIL